MQSKCIRHFFFSSSNQIRWRWNARPQNQQQTIDDERVSNEWWVSTHQKMKRSTTKRNESVWLRPFEVRFKLGQRQLIRGNLWCEKPLAWTKHSLSIAWQSISFLLFCFSFVCVQQLVTNGELLPDFVLNSISRHSDFSNRKKIKKFRNGMKDRNERQREENNNNNVLCVCVWGTQAHT